MLIIVTGGLGFLGSKLVNNLLKKNYKVVIIDKKKTIDQNLFQRSKKIKIYNNINISSTESLNKIKINEANIVLHCAGQPSAARSFEIPKQDLNINILGTFNIINWAKRNYTKKIIYASTFNVYEENISKTHLKESFPC